MQSERTIEEPRMLIVDNQIMSFRFRVKGGSTGDHFVQYLSGDWRCDCHGFMSHAKCRHVKSGQILLDKINEGLTEIEKGERENWQKNVY